MRKNLLEVWAAYTACENHDRHRSISTKRSRHAGGAIFSYDTPILVDQVRWMEGGPHSGTRWEVWTREDEIDPQTVALNAEHYSRTTTTQQRALRVLLERDGFVLQPGLLTVADTPSK